MNLFILDKDPVKAAQLQCDKHVVKMIVESAQMLSTAHRMLDGHFERRPSKSGKTMSKYWRLPDSREDTFYKAVHMHHPCTVWTMESNNNYNWHWVHFAALCDEYTYRYGKVHETFRKLNVVLSELPTNIPKNGFREPPQCMPEDVKSESVIEAYHKYYAVYKKDFARWTERPIPSFMS